MWFRYCRIKMGSVIMGQDGKIKSIYSNYSYFVTSLSKLSFKFSRKISIKAAIINNRLPINVQIALKWL